MKQTTGCLIILLVLNVKAFSQEWNFGVHLNPVLTTPFDTKNRIPGGDAGIIFPTFDGHNFSASTGLDIKWAHLKWALRTGMNLSGKTYTLHTATADFTSGSTSFEIPLEYSRQLWVHDKRLKYTVNLVLGAAYEYNSIDETGISGNDNSFHYWNQSYYDGIGSYRQFYNLLAGVNVNTIIHKFGLIDYGIVLHYPVKTIPVQDFYIIESRYVNGALVTSAAADFQPKLACIDFRFCYYFLSLDKKGKRIKYRKR